MTSKNPSNKSRRQFLKTSSAAVVGASLVGTGARNVHAVGNDLLKVGLIGCGGRGTGAASQALRADKNVKLWAMADVFPDRLERSLAILQKDGGLKDKIDVPAERRFVGFEAYQRVIDSCDVVLLCTPPGFRPLHMRAAVQARKHIFAEKPVAVDTPGVHSVLASCELARKNNLSVVSGLCLRSSTHYREIVRRLQDGAIGAITGLQANDLRGRIWMFPREKNWTDMEWQMRNWYYFTWLSGDFNVEQHVHNLDVCAWIMRDQYPTKCVGMGGRQARTGPEFGQIYDHFAVTYEYENGTKVYSNTRQMVACKNDITVYVQGTNGKAVVCERARDMAIHGPKAFRPAGKDNDFYQTEHDDLFASIRQGKPINNGEYMSKSTLMAIMARMAAYTGQEITWEMAWTSKEDLSPAKYDWKAPPPAPTIAVPGVTRFL